MKGFKDLAMENRFKAWTDGNSGQVVLGIENIKQDDEGAYKCVLNGDIEHEFSVYVTGTLDKKFIFVHSNKIKLNIWTYLINNLIPIF